MNRRHFMGWAGAGLGGAALSMWPRTAWADLFGTFPAEASHLVLPAELQAKNVLEVFLYGGLSAWESLYDVESLTLDYMRESATTFLGSCAASGSEPVPIGPDALGETVRIGAFAHALWARPDVTDRMRVLVTSHLVDPHEGAIPLALTGKPVGNPMMAGLGAHIQRYFLDREPERLTPFSYVLRRSAAEESDAAIDATTSTGSHPSSAQPLRINADSAGALTTLLTRPGAGSLTDRAHVDALLASYIEQYERRVTWTGQRLRSPQLDQLASANGAAANADSLLDVIEGATFTPIDKVVCGVDGLNIPAMSMRLAAYLLTHPTAPARYIGIVDSGLEETAAGGYDSHYYPIGQATNLHNILSELMSVINAPGENDPAKLNLDDTLVIINTEFGRTREPDSNHLPRAYATAMIGGPITAPGVHGAIGADSVAVSPLQPSDSRIGALLALGIYPFSTDSFAVADATGADDEAHGVQLVTESVLGVSA
jgi:hypothetical protein